MFDFVNLEIKRGKNPMDVRGIFEIRSKYRNMHYMTLKHNAAIFGIIGIKIVKWIHSEHDLYSRFDLIPTELLFSQDLALEKRKELIQYNLKHFTNLKNPLNDKDYYLWMKLAEDNDLFIDFKDQQAFEKRMKKIEQDILNYGEKEELLLSILRFCERLHWIKVINVDQLTFEIKLKENKGIEFMLAYLSKKAQIKQNKNHFSINSDLYNRIYLVLEQSF
ncbi:MAG: hypothetical protein ACTSR8_18720 [Promethearchaeota archaeon]